MLINLPKQPKESKDLGLKYRIYLALMTYVDLEKYPKPEKATIKESVLKEGKKYNYLDGTVASLKPNVQPGENQFKGVPMLPVIIEGMSKESLDYVYQNVGEDFNIIFERCADGQKFIMGDPCSGGMKMKYTSIGEQEGGLAGIGLEFTGGECSQPLLYYDGEIEVEEDAPPVAGRSVQTKNTPKE